MCGGTACWNASPCRPAGLSPRVRGNPLRCTPPGWPGRSIPACAGEPAARRRTPRAEEVYPRVCGGTERPALPQLRRHGLSPRVRGNRNLLVCVNGQPGSIPACAGEPSRVRRGIRPREVYPRVCGGTADLVWASPPCQGLSPRVRGNLAGVDHPLVDGGSIPACAGEPGRGVAAGIGGKVYPRVCGGTACQCARAPPCSGLSPRVRGNRAASGGMAGADRSIPACAGEPRPAAETPPAPWVYPRVCGGTR